MRFRHFRRLPIFALAAAATFALSQPAAAGQNGNGVSLSAASASRAALQNSRQASGVRLTVGVSHQAGAASANPHGVRIVVGPAAIGAMAAGAAGQSQSPAQPETIRRHLLGIETPPAAQRAPLDRNGDGKIDVSDLIQSILEERQ